MVHCRFLHDEENRLTGFQISGHAKRGSKGNDPVCAAVSTLAQTCITGLKDVLGIPLTIRHRNDGELYVRIAGTIEDGEQKRVNDLLQVIEHGLQYVAQNSVDGTGSAVKVEHSRDDGAVG